MDFGKEYNAQGLPYIIQLTDKGMELVLSKQNISKVNFHEAVRKWGSIVKIVYLIKECLE